MKGGKLSYRFVGLMNLAFIAAVSIFLCPFVFAASSGQRKSQHGNKKPAASTYVVELTVHNFTSNMQIWEKDLAIMFYAPWCKYCKQLLPTWETIAQLSRDNTNLAISMFNCEGSKSHEQICAQVGIDRYPTIYFLGYGDFNQGPQGAMIGRTREQRLVKFVSDLYPEAVYDWVNMLAVMSGIHRRWDDVTGFFTGQSRDAKNIAQLTKLKDEAEKKAFLFGKQLEKYKANELFDSLEDHGDPFPILHGLEPNEVEIEQISYDYKIEYTVEQLRTYFFRK